MRSVCWCDRAGWRRRTDSPAALGSPRSANLGQRSAFKSFIYGVAWRGAFSSAEMYANSYALKEQIILVAFLKKESKCWGGEEIKVVPSNQLAQACVGSVMCCGN